MKVTYSWLKDFVEIKISASALADKLTMAGLEVTALEAGDRDSVFEIEVTSNRPDCLSVIGIAREVAAITGKKLKLSPFAIRHSPFASDKSLAIKIEDKKDCPLYTAKIIHDVTVRPSPGWLRERLEMVGCRSVNNIVDITNYVLLTWGEPLHAFDLDKLKPGAIIVRRGSQAEKIIAIDGTQRILSADILVIADREKPVAIAGVMGGEDTEVTESTKRILLEAAIFNPVVIRRCRQKLGMRSDAAYRFERGIDPEIVERASWAAVRMIQELAGGRCVAAQGSGSVTRKKKSINLDVAKVHKILGVDIAFVAVKKILDRLGFKTKRISRNSLKVGIPAYRADVNLEMDLIEEISRMFGYENIPKSLPLMTPQVSAIRSQDLVSLIKNTLLGLGLNEVITYALIDRSLLRGLERDFSQPIEILNPLSREQEILRPTIISSLSRCVADNLNQKQNYINIFEIAKVFSDAGGRTPKEEPVLGIALCGIRPWLFTQGLIKDQQGFLHFKGILETLFGRLGIPSYNFSLTEANDTQEVSVYIKGEKIGVIVKLPQVALENLDIKNKDVFVGEFCLDRLLAYANLAKKFEHLPAYPAITRDISLILKEGINVEDILSTIRQKCRPFLREARVVDYYRGEQIPRGFKGLTISCLYLSSERTLTETEINPLHSLACAALKDTFGAQIR